MDYEDTVHDQANSESFCNKLKEIYRDLSPPLM